MAESEKATNPYNSWFLTFNNPRKHGYSGSNQDILEKLATEWLCDKDTRSFLGSYCISADGLEHVHMVVYDERAQRFSAIKKIYKSAHIQFTRGSKQQAEDYVYKRGDYEEKGEQVLDVVTYGDIKANQGKRNDLVRIDEYLRDGYSPREILNINFSYRKYDKMIRDAFFDMKRENIPVIRDIKVYWHCGASGTGKTFEYVRLCEKYGRDNVYLANDYDNSGSSLFDKYNGEKVVVMDEFKGQITFGKLLILLDRYAAQVHCRYANVYALWDEIHVMSIFPPELIYRKMVSEDTKVDTITQLNRRITNIVYHYKDDGMFKSYEMDMGEYISYDILKSRALSGSDDGFLAVDKNAEPLPFD